MDQSQIGLIGLGPMGSNIARNIANHKFPVVTYNRTTSKMEALIKEYGSEYLTGQAELKDFVAQIATPRKIIILVKAGEPVQMVIDSLLPLLDQDDIIIDCGNSYYKDTQRRQKELKEKGLNYIGCGVSGGEEGALNGPSLMPGGDQNSWSQIKEIFEAIAAKDFSDQPCVTYIGDDGAGHYVKMVHNGIEYGVMQMMAEAYEILRTAFKLPAPEIADVFQKLDEGKLKSYLFEIAQDVLRAPDDQNPGDHLIDKILDKAAQKGTGKWTAIDALDRGMPLPTITEAVYARVLSSQKEKRQEIAQLYERPTPQTELALPEFTELLEDALYTGMLSSYAQGYELIQLAAAEEDWTVDLGEISRIWEGGCIIRADILNQLHKAYSKGYQHLFALPDFQGDLKTTVPKLRQLVSFMTKNGLPSASLATSLSYFESMTSKNLSANLIQGLRDRFGSHTYERTDKEGSFHTEW